MSTSAYKVINAITWYRVITAPVLVLLLVFDRIDIFKWMLPISFFTDAIDGFLARKFKVTSVFGARLDSIGDDLTVLAGLAGIIIWKPDFLWDRKLTVIILLVLFIIQVLLALYRYRRTTSFHTYGAKLAAVAQGIFLILFFWTPDLSNTLFYIAAVITGLELVEEILIVLSLKEWKTNVHGLYWVLRKEKTNTKN